MVDLSKRCLKVAVGNATESVFVQEQFFRLGGLWGGRSRSIEQEALDKKYLFLDSGFLGFSDGENYFKTAENLQLTLEELENYVDEVLIKETKRTTEKGGITWQKAYTTIVEGGEVQIWNNDQKQWETLTHYDSWSIVDLSQELLRVKPVMIYINEGEYSEEDLIKLMENFK